MCHSPLQLWANISEHEQWWYVLCVSVLVSSESIIGVNVSVKCLCMCPFDGQDNCPVPELSTLMTHLCFMLPLQGRKRKFCVLFFFCFSFFFCKKELKYAIFLLYSPLTRTKPHFFRKVYRQKRNSVPFCVHTLSSFQRGPGFSF